MDIKLGTGNRITIPFKMIEQQGWNIGDILSITNEGDYIKITKCVSEKPMIKSTSVGKVEIKSNIDKLDQYSKAIISDCGLVVRTKRKYLDNFCKLCKGQLLDETHQNCNYVIFKESESGNEIENHKVHTQKEDKLNEEDDKNIISRNSQDEILASLNALMKKYMIKKPRSPETTLEYFTDIHLHKCNGCGKYFYRGFMIDYYFHCKQCACKDFKEYYLKNKEGKKC